MLTFPVAVRINNSVGCIPYIEKDELFRMDAVEEYGGLYEEPVAEEWTEAGTDDREEPAETEETEEAGSAQEELLEKLGELVEALTPEEGTETPETGEHPEGDSEPRPDGTGDTGNPVGDTGRKHSF